MKGFDKMNVFNKNKGITLVALVVTVVVLLTLAGVSINLVIGQNGLINRAKEAKEKTKEAEEKEWVELAVTSSKIEDVSTLKAEAQKLEKALRQ